MINISVTAKKTDSAGLILCNVLYSCYNFVDEYKKNLKLKKQDKHKIDKIQENMGILIYQFCDILEKYE